MPARRTRSLSTEIAFLACLVFACLAQACTAPSEESDPDDQGFENGRNSWVIGHRGSPWSAVENTIESFQMALDENADAIEIDVCVTADNQVVVWHDCNPENVVALLRQSGGEGLPYIPSVPAIRSEFRRNVRDLSLDELREHFDYAPNKNVFRNVVNAQGVNAHIPTLSEVAEWAARESRGRLKGIFLDIKLSEDDADLLPILEEEVVKLFDDAPYAIFPMSPHLEIITSFRERLSRSAPHIAANSIWDHEKDGAVAASLGEDFDW